MKKIKIEDVPSTALSGPLDRRGVSEELGATDMVIMYYDLNPGEPFSAAYHTHHSQEEVFYILSGTATFDTGQEGTVTVEAGEAIRFGPGEYQQGFVGEDQADGVTALALGAPPGMDETIIIWECENCGEETPHDVELDEVAGWEHLFCQKCNNKVVVLPKEETDETSDLF